MAAIRCIRRVILTYDYERDDHYLSPTQQCPILDGRQHTEVYTESPGR